MSSIESAPKPVRDAILKGDIEAVRAMASAGGRESARIRANKRELDEDLKEVTRVHLEETNPNALLSGPELAARERRDDELPADDR
jgi:uncharacterized sporulation protein YeaH/YhbH (DUF444 family)